MKPWRVIFERFLGFTKRQLLMWQSIGLISLGAVLGAVSRWFLSLWLNPLFSGFAFGVLIANLISCFLIGIFTALCWHFPAISDHWKLLIVTGFFGSLSTMSSLSSEVLENLLQGKIAIGLVVLSSHLIGSLIATFLGILLILGLFKS